MASTTSLAQSHDLSLLVLIVDTNPYYWAQKSVPSGADGVLLSLSDFLDQLLIFINTYFMMHPKNMLAIFASHAKTSNMIFPSYKKESERMKYVNMASADSDLHLLSAQGNDWDVIREEIIKEILALPSHDCLDSEGKPHPTMLSAAMSLALCYTNRITKERPQIKPRIFSIVASPDVPSQYVAMMNCIFSAQRQDIPVDTCVLHSRDSTFLQQASHITHGIYLKPSHPDALLQYLLSVFLADRYSRRFLKMPIQTSVDFRASCFCHKNTIDTGFVCSICLSIFCTFSTPCKTCGARFLIPMSKSKAKAAPKK